MKAEEGSAGGEIEGGQAVFVVQRLPTREDGKIQSGAYHATTSHLL